METRFLKLITSLTQRKTELVSQDFCALISLYNQPHRFYHNKAHIQHCLAEFDLFVSQFRDSLKRNELELAIWYHDAVYDTHANDNEEKSARLASSYCDNIGLTQEFAELVTQLILTTKHIQTDYTSLEHQLIADIDLTILGQSHGEYEKYSENIRKEYSWVEVNMYRSGRKGILQSFLLKDHIFNTDFFRIKYEAMARENLQSEICKLDQMEA